MDILELFGVIIGLLYLYFEYKGSIYLWIVGIIMPIIYIKIYHDAGLYADMGCNIYYLLASFYGLAVWMLAGRKTKKSAGENSKQKKELKISHVPLKFWFPQAVISIVVFFIMVYVLKTYTNSNVPYWDSFTTTLSIIGMWQLARKYIEQWLTWIAVDAVSVVLYCYKGLYLTAILFFIYTLIAVAGYFKWQSMMEKESLS
ncbi:MAG: nicotinamide mononucleotide transporter [Prolixibacteraceae bacterium]|nr:nicotinamide mononucleotide transporter [Prolixibacteraceae bacterium]